MALRCAELGAPPSVMTMERMLWRSVLARPSMYSFHSASLGGLDVWITTMISPREVLTKSCTLFGRSGRDLGGIEGLDMPTVPCGTDYRRSRRFWPGNLRRACTVAPRPAVPPG